MSCGEKSNAFANLHDVTLQRLDVYHRNNGGYVFYDSKHFAPTVRPLEHRPSDLC